MDGILALDFDGVIVDSAREVYVVALRTYAALRPGSPLAGHPLVAAGSAAGHDFEGDALHRRFVEAMALGNRAEDFGVTLAALEEGLELGDQEAYDRVKRRWSGPELEAFHRRFYQERARFREEEPATWYALQRPYPHLVELLRRRGEPGRLAVLTARDRASVGLLLEAFGLRELVPGDLVLDKETGVRKVEHVRELCRRTGEPPRRVTFVDDKVSHLVATASLGVRGVLAGWGHNTPREHTLAASLGFPVATVGSAGEVLFGTAAGKGRSAGGVAGRE